MRGRVAKMLRKRTVVESPENRKPAYKLAKLIWNTLNHKQKGWVK